MKKTSDLQIVNFQDLTYLEQRAVFAAREVQPMAYAPYSNYKVGVAVVSISDRIYTGVNVENVYPAF